MPFYSWLSPRSHDSVRSLKTKQRATQKIKQLRAAFNAHVQEATILQNGLQNGEPPADQAQYVRIATWNIREFDSSSYGYRSQESKAYIAEILSQFDLIALQEVRRDLSALNDVTQLLGPDWDYIATDVTEGDSGNEERMVFLFNKKKVWFRNVAGELTLPHDQKITDPFGERFRVEGGAQLELPEGDNLVSPARLKVDTLASGQTKLRQAVEIPLPEGTKIVLPPGSSIRFAQNAKVPITSDNRIDFAATPTIPESAEIVLPPNSLVGGPQQFARTPFIASFQAGWLKINLATVHIYYGSGATGIERRKEEIRRLTALLADKAKSDNDSDADSYFMVLGDFNIVGPGHETMDALRTNDFMIPEPLQHVPGSNVKQDKFYDQIALWTGESSRRKPYTRIVPYRAGVFDFFDVVYRSDEEEIYRPLMRRPESSEFYSRYLDWRTHQMSDHLPMWVELRIDFTEEYLDKIEVDLQAKLG
ncbi:endonuclease/exonuclease/phosphatase family protein [Leptothoe sp. PORK10 BA2]|uniref:endonuclease/exonuclease/phosphatase family protein n=1 Tax=Leptothoe sp. PORK10 BA2 TaxID=3110254 RepID=UPI002B20EA4A|nr:endonuclease/exonuclease/phosphatase family protein [Leptothoe sp. PORK10 BA2]MEA5462529.1 endonuclease/exonuclease/phosphatase family protein [Leptothoe sp. PORK10 BA2]